MELGTLTLEYPYVSGSVRGAVVLEKKKLLFVVNVDWFFLSHRLPIAVEAIKQGYEVHIATAITNKLDLLESNGLVVQSLNLHRSP